MLSANMMQDTSTHSANLLPPLQPLDAISFGALNSLKDVCLNLHLTNLCANIHQTDPVQAKLELMAAAFELNDRGLYSSGKW